MWTCDGCDEELEDGASHRCSAKVVRELVDARIDALAERIDELEEEVAELRAQLGKA